MLMSMNTATGRRVLCLSEKMELKYTGLGVMKIARDI